MNSLKNIFLFTTVALILLFVFPIQSVDEHSEKAPTRHKRWTFNTWRLHGRRQLANGLIVFFSLRILDFFFLDFYSSKPFPTDEDHAYEIFHNDNDLARELLRKYIRR